MVQRLLWFVDWFEGLWVRMTTKQQLKMEPASTLQRSGIGKAEHHRLRSRCRQRRAAAQQRQHAEKKTFYICPVLFVFLFGVCLNSLNLGCK